MTALRKSLEAFAPQLVERYSMMIHRQFDALVDNFGPTMRKGVHSVSNSQFYAVWSQEIRPCCKANTVPGDLSGRDTFYTLNDEAIKTRGERYAQATIEAWEAKITAKMGELTEAECHRLDGVRFLITGKRGELSVRIEQDMIINVSTKGKLFNQFPARIYVEGKFTSEAKYKKLPAVAAADDKAAQEQAGIDAEAAQWVPEDDPDAWKARDAALIDAARRKK